MFRVTDYFYTPKDIVRALRIRHAVGLAVGVFLLAGLKTAGVGLDVSIFVTAIVTTLIWELDARVPFIGAIVCFLLIMVASLVSPETTSTAGTARERLAVFAFYFLVIGVVLLIREHIKPHSEATHTQQHVQAPAKQRKNPTKIIGRLAIKHSRTPTTRPHTAPVMPAPTQTTQARQPLQRMPRRPVHAPTQTRATHIAAPTTPNARTNPHLLDLRAIKPKPAQTSAAQTHNPAPKQRTVVNDIRPQPVYTPTVKKAPRRIQL